MILAFKRFLYALSVSFRPHKSRTVRYAFPLAFASMLFLSAAVLDSQEASYIRLTSNETYVEEGDTFTIEVHVNAHIPVNAVNIEVAYPEDQIEIIGIDTGTSVITIWTEEPSWDNGVVSISGGTFRKGFEGEHIVAEISARAKTSGAAKFSTDEVRLLAGDGRGTQVSVSESGEETYTMYAGVVTNEKGEMVIEGNLKVGIYTDIDGDGKVDMSDVMDFMSAWRSKQVVYDFNKDGKMTFVDFAIILADSFFK